MSRVTRKRYAFLQIRWILHKCLTIEVEQRQSRQECPPAGIWKRCFIFLLWTKNKTVAFVLCRKSYTHTYALSVTIFNINCLIVAVLVNWKSRNSYFFLYQTFCLPINCHVKNVIFRLFCSFFFFFASNWTSNVCDILYAFLFDVRNLRLGYLMILCIWKCVLLLLGWLFILSMDVWFSTVSDKIVPVHQLVRVH